MSKFPATALTHRFSTSVVFFALVALPLLLLPLGTNFLVDSKLMLLLFIAVATFLIWAVFTFFKKTLQITLSPFVAPLVLLSVSVLVSSFWGQTVPANQLLGFGGVYLALVTIVIFAPTILPKTASRLFLPILALPATLLSFASIAELLGAGPSQVINAALPFHFPASPLFSLTGSPVIAAEFLVMVTASMLVALVGRKLRPFFAALFMIAVIGLAVNIRTIVQQGANNISLPWAASWSITTDLLKSVPNAFIGVGPDNFNQAYLQLKPAWLNTTPSWNLTYNQASNVYLSVFITLGALGLAAWIWLTVQAVRHFRASSVEARPLAVFVLVGLLIELVLPPNVVILGVQALAMALWVVSEQKNFKRIQMHTFTVQITESDSDVQKVPKNSHFLVYLTSAVCVLVLGVVGWWLGRYTVAQFESFMAVVATAQNDAVGVYSRQQTAVLIYPYAAAFRRDYSSTNMFIALNLAAKKDLSDADKQQVIGLVQQAINESKAASSIQPGYSLNWVNMARIYSNLIGTAQGADSWAINAYSQAVVTAPTDPTLRLEAGGLYYRLNQSQQAVQVFEQTVALKSDWPNAYYNLANAYKLNKENDKAVAAYQQTLALLQDQPEQKKVVQAELEQLQKDIANAAKPAAPAPVAKTPVAPKTASGSALLAPTAGSSTATVSPAAKDALKNVNLTPANQ